MLTTRGYCIKRENCNVSRITRELYVCPEIDSVMPVQKYKVFRERPDMFVLPRFYGIHEYGYRSNISPGIEIENTDFNGVLREATSQPEAVETTIAHLRKHYGGILSLPTGYGKTTVALYILSVLKQRTLIFVHKEFLMNQWIEKINQFLPNLKVGKIQSKTVDVVGKDIVIAMIQSVSGKEYNKDIFDGFGFTIIDETHHVCTRTFSRIFFKVNTYYVLGLSATLERKDGLTKVIHWFIGELCYSVSRKEQHHVTVQKLKFTCDRFSEDFPTNRMKKPSIVEAVTVLVNIVERNERIVKHIIQCCKQHRKVIVLSDRRDHCMVLNEMMKDCEYSTGLYLGGMKQSVLKENEKCNIIIGTYSLAHEGLDIPSLDTLVMATPKVDIIQSVGRILRETTGKKNNPLVIDIVDQWGCFMSQFNKRRKYYNDTGFFVLNDTEVKKVDHVPSEYLFED